MKFTVDREPLLKALQATQSVVDKKSTKEILSHLLCTVKDRTLSISATDLEVGMKISLPVDSSQEGKLTLTAKNFFEIVKELPNKPLHITRKDNHWVELSCGRSRFNIMSLSAEEYPSLPNFEAKEYLDARVEALRSMIDRTAFAVSTDATRYHLNGVYFEPMENAIMRMTATDGHRLSFVDSEVFKKNPEMKRGMIIPKKGLMELRKFLDEAESTIGLAFEKGYVFARIDQAYLFLKLIEGEYPDYRQVIPKANDRTVRLNREIFSSALRRVSLLANEKSRAVKFQIQPGLMTITSSNPEMGEATEEIEVDYKGEALDVGFNSKYLTECLAVMNSDELVLHLKDRLSPGLLQGTHQLDHTYVIMPMRI